ncbi:FAD-dependent monooxygenase [Halomonas beimenensis]|uniref:2-polyprenyl-6-methoxyphenol hydroxylase-related FAD-dependent oxidoreductase n=1 Tax=Halomonas beimenensis TaxID=475662 RepID=A0A291P2F3_9GAMM|nr:FAD-dependent monooxygenase [Halomonas beimenensis]ATJ81061.1 2-polyprenyl-6-methoxyphenol hydroxylase-related FAD-dependent oxidoreductase [Halomonas beimenensis]
MTSLKIGICGGGVGGLCAALALRQQGHEAIVFERAKQFLRIGADVNLTPNAVRALDRLGVGEVLRETAARPTHRISRTWDTGEETSRLPMSEAAEVRYGAPQLTIHRGDLLQALANALPEEAIRLGKQAERVEQGEPMRIHFADGTSEEVDLVVGGDGIHSAVRRELFGEDHPEFTGLVSYRAVVPRSAVPEVENLDAFTKWWGPSPDVQVVVFPLTRGEEVFIFATTPQDDWREESWTLPGDVDELRRVYRAFHPDVQALLAACDSVTKSALYVREPMPQWSVGHATLLGDAAHPMVPFMAQGACMAIEDAVVLSRCLEGVDRAGLSAALQRYEEARKARTAQVQRGSRANDWLKGEGTADWVYGYDAWGVELP